MNLIEIGYHSALSDLGLEKTAAGFGWLKQLFSRAPKAVPKAGPGVTAMDDVERFAAGRTPRKPPGANATGRAEDAFAGVKPKAPAGQTAAPAAPPGAPPPASPAASAPPPQAAAGGGMLNRIRRNPLMSVGLAGAGAGGLGYVTGMGAPPPSQPMQQYGQQQMPMGYQ
jgi:hypothetical protein